MNNSVAIANMNIESPVDNVDLFYPRSTLLILSGLKSSFLAKRFMVRKGGDRSLFCLGVAMISMSYIFRFFDE